MSMIETVARAIEAASARRAYGLYDYSGYPGDEPPHVVREETGTRRILLATHDAGEAERLHEKLQRGYAARAAIAAMREPTEAMVWAAPGRSGTGSEGSMYHGIWRAMIDAALAEGGADG